MQNHSHPEPAVVKRTHVLGIPAALVIGLVLLTAGSVIVTNAAAGPAPTNIGPPVHAIRHADSSGLCDGAGRCPIKHVVFIIKENHSFDNLFARFPGADGTSYAMAGNRRVPLRVTPDHLSFDISHAGNAATVAVNVTDCVAPFGTVRPSGTYVSIRIPWPTGEPELLGTVTLMVTTSTWLTANDDGVKKKCCAVLLIVTALTLAFISGATLRVFSEQDSYPAALILSLLLALAMFPNAQPQYTDAAFTINSLMDFEVQSHELLGETIWSQHRPDDSPLVEQYRAGNLTQKAVVTAGNATVELIEHHSQGDIVRVTASEPSHILFYTRYFPGWQMTIDGEPTKNFGPDGEQGLIGILIPAGTHTITTRFGDTPARQIGAGVSLFSFIGAAIWLWKTRRQLASVPSHPTT